MNTPTNKVKISENTEVELKQWITGRQAEYINEPLMESLDMKPDGTGSISMNSMDLKKVVLSNHREIESFVVSVNGKTEKVLEEVLNLPESEYDIVVSKIKELRKKK